MSLLEIALTLLACGAAPHGLLPQTSPTTADAGAGAAAESGWKVERIAAAEGATTVPDKVPAAFAKLLAPEGVRVTAPDGKVRAELWWRTAIPFTGQKPSGNVLLAALAPGEFVGVLRAPGGTSDYRQQPIEAGLYGLRYFQQPSDPNHLGTADSRDFLVLTSLAEESTTDAVSDQDALVALAVPASSTDHAMILYATPASEPAPADGAARVVRRGELDEWTLECTLSGAKRPEEPAAPTLRIALVVEGHAAH